MDKPTSEWAAARAQLQVCTHCGKFGCECDLKEAFSHLCRKCNSDPCECEGKTIKPHLGDVCTVCHRHRAMCICTSHHPVRTMQDPEASRLKPTRPYEKAYIETLVNEGMLHYYQRDADGLARWLRRVLP